MAAPEELVAKFEVTKLLKQGKSVHDSPTTRGDERCGLGAESQF